MSLHAEIKREGEEGKKKERENGDASRNAGSLFKKRIRNTPVYEVRVKREKRRDPLKTVGYTVLLSLLPSLLLVILLPKRRKLLIHVCFPSKKRRKRAVVIV